MRKVVELTFRRSSILSRAPSQCWLIASPKMAMKMALSFNTSGLGSWVAKLLGTADPAIGPPAPTGAVGIERVPL